MSSAKTVELSLDLESNDNMRPLSIGILGAGRVGTAIGRQTVRGGHSVRIATNKPADEIKLLTEVIVPGAVAVNKEELHGWADIIVVAVPLHKYKSIDVDILEGHVVIDTMNYWSPVDGVMEEFEVGKSTSEVLADYFGSDVEVVKTLNHIGYGELEVDSHSAGDPRRRGIVVSGDSYSAKKIVSTFVDSLGYDPVDAGPLSAGRIMENGTELFSGRFTAADIEVLLQSQLVLD